VVYGGSGDIGCESLTGVTGTLGIHHPNRDSRSDLFLGWWVAVLLQRGPLTVLASRIDLLASLHWNQQRSSVQPLKDNSRVQVAVSLRMQNQD
jgi:hypothetical protein